MSGFGATVAPAVKNSDLPELGEPPNPWAEWAWLGHILWCGGKRQVATQQSVIKRSRGRHERL